MVANRTAPQDHRWMRGRQIDFDGFGLFSGVAGRSFAPELLRHSR